MSSIVIAGDTSGSVTLQAPATAGTTVLTLPATSGTLAIGSGALTLLSTVTASNSATVDVETTFDSTYKNYLLVAEGVTVDGSRDLYCRLKIAGAYVTSASYWYHSMRNSSSDAAYNAIVSQSDTSITISQSNSGASSSCTNFTMNISHPDNTAFQKAVYWNGTSMVASSLSRRFIGGAGSTNSGVQALTGVRFLADAGNINAGTFRLYGLANS